MGTKGNESKYGKVVRRILLNDYFAKLIEEEDKAIELFLRVATMDRI